MIVVKVKIRPLIHRLLNTINLRCSVHPGVVCLMKYFNLLFVTPAARLQGRPHGSGREEISMLTLAWSPQHGHSWGRQSAESCLKESNEISQARKEKWCVLLQTWHFSLLRLFVSLPHARSSPCRCKEALALWLWLVVQTEVPQFGNLVDNLSARLDTTRVTEKMCVFCHLDTATL